MERDKREKKLKFDLLLKQKVEIEERKKKENELLYKSDYMGHIESNSDEDEQESQKDSPQKQLAIMPEEEQSSVDSKFSPDTDKIKCLNDSWTFKDAPSNLDDDKKVTMFIPNVNFMAKKSELNWYLSDEGKPPPGAKSMSFDDNFKYVGLLIPCLNTGPEFNDNH